MISTTGKNLSVVIFTETGRDWEAFGTWYSVFKNLPEAKAMVACQRTEEAPFQFFQWTKRLNVPIFHYNPINPEDQILNKLNVLNLHKSALGDYILVMDHLTMVLAPFDQLDSMNDSWIEENMWFLNKANIELMINDHVIENKLTTNQNNMCIEASEEKALSCLISYKKGCGKWINKLKGCPFSNAAGLVSSDMTINEIKVIELWKRMCLLYSTVI